MINEKRFFVILERLIKNVHHIAFELAREDRENSKISPQDREKLNEMLSDFPERPSEPVLALGMAYLSTQARSQISSTLKSTCPQCGEDLRVTFGPKPESNDGKLFMYFKCARPHDKNKDKFKCSERRYYIIEADVMDVSDE